jgi:GT2 family glycosyltransferase
MDKPKISVYINNTTPNSGLGECLLNVFGNIPNQYLHTVTVTNTINEVNVIEMLHNYKLKHKDQLIINHDLDNDNLNISQSYNDMVKASRSEVSLFLEPNVSIKSETIEAMLNQLYKSDSVGVVSATVKDKFDKKGAMYHDVEMFDQHGMWYNSFKRPVRHLEGAKRVIGIPYQAFAIKTAIFGRIGGFDENLTTSGMELDLCLQTLIKTFENYTIIGTGVIEDTMRRRNHESVDDSQYFYGKWQDKGQWAYAIPN